MKRLIAEFEEQSYTQIIFPHKKTDWAEYLDEAEKTFIKLTKFAAKNNIKVAFNPSEYQAIQGYKRLKPILENTNFLILNKVLAGLPKGLPDPSA